MMAPGDELPQSRAIWIKKFWANVKDSDRYLDACLRIALETQIS